MYVKSPRDQFLVPGCSVGPCCQQAILYRDTCIIIVILLTLHIYVYMSLRDKQMDVCNMFVQLNN